MKTWRAACLLRISQICNGNGFLKLHDKKITGIHGNRSDEEEKRYENAERLLTRANAVSPNNFVILYNLGVCNYSFSEYYFNQQNQLAIHQGNPEDIKMAKDNCEHYLQKAADYFEQARAMQPNDVNLLNTLRAIYVRQQSPKADEIDALIKQLEK